MQFLKNLIIALLILFLLVTWSTTSLMAQAVHFTSFVWSGGELSGINHPKMALWIPAKILGIEKTFFIQLDTGTNGSHLYGNVLTALNLGIDSTVTKSLPITWFDDEQSSFTSDFPINWNRKEPTSILSSESDSILIGTIGTDLLLNKILIIDFPHTRYAVFDDSAALPEDIRNHARYVTARIEYGMFFVSVILGTDTLSVFYDTGSSLANLLLPMAIWQKATGLTGDEPSVRVDSVPSWDKPLPILSAPARADMIFGDIRIKSPTIVAAKWPDGSDSNMALMGNAPFYDDYMVIVDFLNARMAVMRTSN